MAQDFTIGNSLSFGWDAMKKNFLLFLYICLTLLGVQAIVAITEHTDIAALIAIVAFLAMMLLQIGITGITLNVVDGKSADYKQLLENPSLFPDYLIATVLYMLIIVGGLILLIVPGIIWAVKFSFYGYYIVDKKMGPIDALKASAKATYGHKWDLFLMWLAIIGINIVGALALLIGLFATIPTSMVAATYAYRIIDAQNPQTASSKAPVSEAKPAVQPAKAAKAPAKAPAKSAKKKR